MARKLTKEDFVNRANEIHSHKYDYSKFEYINAITKSIIICPIQGEFMQSSNVHLRGVGCPKCVVHKSTKKLSKEDILFKAEQIHGDKYEYDLGNFINSSSKIRIYCKKHNNWFEQTIRNHLRGQGCPICASDNKRSLMSITKEEFIERANKRHKNKFNYSKVEFKNNKDIITIICPIHGEFNQRVDEHLKGRGCAKCNGLYRTTEEFIELAKAVHNERYDYSMVEYINSEHKITIKCNQCGNIFEQKPFSHLQGHGCPYCRQSRLELEVEDILISNNIEYERQKKFDWLGKLTLDFYLPKYNIAIECQGDQHFNNSRCFGNKELNDVIIKRDKRKYQLCNNNGVDIIYYTNIKRVDETEYIGLLYKDINFLLNKILSYG